jgi:retinoblastoma-like protein 1
MDALISNSSKSYYACVGESTHAYQSPSKDLNAINNRLNGYAFLIATTFTIRDYFFFVLFNRCFYIFLISNRKARGTLNLDNDVGLVSDSMVANSLGLQNGNCASTSGAALKSEQSDS